MIQSLSRPPPEPVDEHTHYVTESSSEEEMSLRTIARDRPPTKDVRRFMAAQIEAINDDESFSD